MADTTTEGGAGGSGSLGSLSGSLGSLTQSARMKSLRSARGIFVVVGLLTAGFNVFSLVTAERLVDKELKTQVDDLHRRGMQVDPVKLQEIRDSLVRSIKLLSIGMILVGLVYLVFAVVVAKYPVPITISGLVIYVGAAAAFGLLDPSTLFRAIIFKVFIIIALVKAVQAAIAYERERKQTAVGAA